MKVTKSFGTIILFVVVTLLLLDPLVVEFVVVVVVVVGVTEVGNGLYELLVKEITSGVYVDADCGT